VTGEQFYGLFVDQAELVKMIVLEVDRTSYTKKDGLKDDSFSG